ncbi:MAG: hypothetical protein IT271_09325 [Chitinophagales bacterium]|nr:hypothetical protein [Chitinophagales bacterium]
MNENIKYLELLLLKLIDSRPSLRNEYRLQFYFAKTEEFSRYGYGLDCLEEKKLIEATEIINTVKHYKITVYGKAYLSENYSIELIKPYIDYIDDSGYTYNNLQELEKLK